MSVKRYVAEDMRQALKQIREELGPDAVILSNRRIDGGVEILASLDSEAVQSVQEVSSASVAAVAGASQGQKRSLDQDPVVHLNSRVMPDRAAQVQTAMPAANGGQAQVDATFEHLMKQYHEPTVRQPDEQLLEAMRSEIDNLRLLLKEQMALASEERWNMKNPLQAAVVKRFETHGLSNHLARQFASLADQCGTVDDAWKAARQRLADAVPVLEDTSLERDGIVALLGATGVGKTTTIAKLAIRYALKHGRDQLALVTTDSYRLAAYEQLRTLGRILDVPVRLVDEHNSLEQVLRALRHKSMVLIDTAGFHPGDAERVQQLQLLSDTRFRIQKLLVLPSTSQSGVLRDVYQLMQRMDLDGCILSKVDEASRLGEVLSLVVEKQLPVAYITDGQKIPDDIRKARPEELVQRLSGEPRGHGGADQHSGDLAKNSNKRARVMPVTTRAALKKRNKPAPVFSAQHA